MRMECKKQLHSCSPLPKPWGDEGASPTLDPSSPLQALLRALITLYFFCVCAAGASSATADVRGLLVEAGALVTLQSAMGHKRPAVARMASQASQRMYAKQAAVALPAKKR